VGRCAFLAGCCSQLKVYNGITYVSFTQDMANSETNSEGKYWWELFPFKHIHIEVN